MLTCSIDNILAVISLNRVTIQNAINEDMSSQLNPKISDLLSLIKENKFDEIRHTFARSMDLILEYNMFFQCYDFYGSEGKAIQILRNWAYVMIDTHRILNVINAKVTFLRRIC